MILQEIENLNQYCYQRLRNEFSYNIRVVLRYTTWIETFIKQSSIVAAIDQFQKLREEMEIAYLGCYSNSGNYDNKEKQIFLKDLAFEIDKVILKFNQNFRTNVEYIKTVLDLM